MPPLFPILLAVLALLSGQDVPPPERAEVQQRIEALEAAGEDASEEELADWRAALAALDEAAEARQRAEGFRRDVAEAPARLKSLREDPARTNQLPSPSELVALGLREREQRLSQAQAELAAARSQVEELGRVRDTRLGRAAAIPEELARARVELSDRAEQLAALPASADGAPRRARVAAEMEVLRQRAAALEAEQAAYEALREVLPLRLDRARAESTRAEQAAAFWQEQVTTLKRAEAERAARAAEAKRDEIVASYPELASVATHNEELAALRSGEDGLPQRIASTAVELRETRAVTAEVERRFRSMRRRIAAGGLTEGMGLVLRRDFEWLPRTRQLEDTADDRAERLSETHLLLLGIEEERASYGSVDRRLAELFAELGVDETDGELAALATELLDSQRELQEEVIRDANELLAVLYDLEVAHGDLTGAAERYRDYIEQRILWVRSVGVNPLPSLLALPTDAFDLVVRTDWPAVVRSVAGPLEERLGRVLGMSAFVALLLTGRRLLKRKRREMGELVRSYRTDRFLFTVRALVQSLLLALPFPLAMLVVGWVASQSTDELARALGLGLREVAPIYLVLDWARQIAKERSVGEAHFRWAARSMHFLRVQLRWFEPTALSLSFVAQSLDHVQSSDWTHSLGRVAFVADMVVLAVFLYRLLRADTPLLAEMSQRSASLLGRTRRLWFAFAVWGPIALSALALSGYYYTALQFEARLRYTLGFAIALVIVNALLLRWLFIIRRRLAIEQARQRAKARAETGEGEPDAARESGASGIDEDEVDIPAVDAQTRQLFRSGLTLAALIGVYVIWASALPALQGLDRVQLLPRLALLDVEVDPDGNGGASAGEEAAPASGAAGGDAAAAPPSGDPTATVTQIAESATGLGDSLGLPAVLTLADVVLALIFVLLTTIAARNLPGLLELAVLQQLPLDRGARYAVTTIVRYLIVIAGVSAVSGALGIGWEKIQWLAAALTFGLAFGLQEIFANFVSGLIILLERPVRVGDVVTVGGTEGRVTRLQMRATTVQDWDRREFLIPNKEFITGSVINWTLTDPVTRLVVPVGIAYGSDTARARSLLLKVARDNPLVLEDPAPQAIFRSFGASSLDFELRVFLGNRDLWPQVVDRLHSEVDFAFRKAGIEIAFPQRDLHLRSLPPGTQLGGATVEAAPREPDAS